MKRIRWLSAEWSAPLRILASRMKADAFTQDSYDGFLVERVRDTYIEARYIERLAYQETLTDPFGNEEFFDRVTYRQVAFNLFADFPNIELWDAPRNIQAFVSRLLELSDFSLSVDHLQVNLLDWVEAFRREVQKDVIIDSVQIGGLEIQDGINAKVLVRGNKDVRKALEHFTLGKRYTLEKLQLKALFFKRMVSVHLVNNGSAKIPDEVTDDLLPLLRISLPNSPGVADQASLRCD